jgi:hypothetical protein
MEEGRRCNVGEYSGGYTHKQTSHHTSTGGRLEPSLNIVLRKKYQQTGTRKRWNHQSGPIWKISPNLYLTFPEKKLTIQVLKQKRTNCIVFDNKAKVCYDRIINGIALLSIRRMGYSKSSVKMLGKIWVQLEHHISTGFGVLDI